MRCLCSNSFEQVWSRPWQEFFAQSICICFVIIYKCITCICIHIVRFCRKTCVCIYFCLSVRLSVRLSVCMYVCMDGCGTRTSLHLRSLPESVVLLPSSSGPYQPCLLVSPPEKLLMSRLSTGRLTRNPAAVRGLLPFLPAPLSSITPAQVTSIQLLRPVQRTPFVSFILQQHV